MTFTSSQSMAYIGMKRLIMRTYLLLAGGQILQVPYGDGAIWRDVQPRLRGEEAPDLALGVELGLEAGGEDVMGLLILDQRHMLTHDDFR